MLVREVNKARRSDCNACDDGKTSRARREFVQDNAATVKIAPTGMKRTLTLALLLCGAAVSPNATWAQEKVEVFDSNISLPQVLAAQKGWCDALITISQDYRTGGLAKARATATKVIDQAYAYQYGPVAFKPTLASGSQTFRTAKEGALAYFVGNDPKFPNDKGFALTPWRTCTIKNQVIQLNGSSAITMGNVVFTEMNGAVTTVDKTWSFMREPDGSVRIVLHHSSLPFTK